MEELHEEYVLSKFKQSKLIFVFLKKKVVLQVLMAIFQKQP
jgi:hypothetical protein